MKLVNMKLVNKLSGIFLLFISSFAFAGGVTPFTDQDKLDRIQNLDLTTDWDSLTPLEGADIKKMVEAMRNIAGTNAATLHNAIGIRSGMVLHEDENWVAKEIKNAEGLNGPILIDKNRTKNNITWYPDYMKGNQVLTQSVRFTTGKFKMGAMPLLGKGFFEIPIENIRKEVEINDEGDPEVIKYWFKAPVEEVLDENGNVGYTTNLDPTLNYYQVLTVKAPVLDFLGYFQVKDINGVGAGEWKIKFIINSDIKINPSEHGDYDETTHPDLDMEVYSHGTALQFPKP